MNKLIGLPNLGKAMQLMAIREELGRLDSDNPFVMAIKIGLRRKDLKRVIEMIKDQAADHRYSVSEMIGEDLLTKIEQL